MRKRDTVQKHNTSFFFAIMPCLRQQMLRRAAHRRCVFRLLTRWGGLPLAPSGRGEGHNVAGGACGNRDYEEATPKLFLHTPAPTTAKAVPLPPRGRLPYAFSLAGTTAKAPCRDDEDAKKRYSVRTRYLFPFSVMPKGALRQQMPWRAACHGTR